jgi:hypothetical protein
MKAWFDLIWQFEKFWIKSGNLLECVAVFCYIEIEET